MSRLSATVTASNASDSVRWPSDEGTLWMWGTWGGGSAKLQASPDGGTTWIDAKDDAGDVISFDADRFMTLKLPDCQVRVQATSVTSISVQIDEIERHR